MVLDENSTDLARAEGDGHHVAVTSFVHSFVWGVCKCNVCCCRRINRIKALVGRARHVLATPGGQQQIATAGVEHDQELLWWGADCDLAIVLAGVHSPASRASGPRPSQSHALLCPLRKRQGLSPQLDSVRTGRQRITHEIQASVSAHREAMHSCAAASEK